MDDRAQRFWSEFETETGERVESRAMGAWLERQGDEQGLWGLLILTDKSFRFKHMPSENWLASMLRFGRKETASPKKENVDIVAPRAELVALVEPQRGFLARVFGPAFARFDLVWRDGGIERRERFQIDPSTELLARLRATIPSGEAG